MMIPLDGTRPNAQYSDLRHAWPDVNRRRKLTPPYCLTEECYRRQPGRIADDAVGVAGVLAGRREGVVRPQDRQHPRWAILPRPLR